MKDPFLETAFYGSVTVGERGQVVIPSKARKELGWKPTVSFDALVREMAREDLAVAEREALVRTTGYSTPRRSAD